MVKLLHKKQTEKHKECNEEISYELQCNTEKDKYRCVLHKNKKELAVSYK